MTQRAFRIDTCEARMDAERTPEGYIRGTASITRTGVFPYERADGTVMMELRHPDDVFRADSLKTMKLMPVQIEHNAMLDSKNMTRFKRGHTGEEIEIDSPFVRNSVVLDAEEAVRAFDGGKREFSCGYYCVLIPETGIYDGVEYTHRQTEIEYNHLALCDTARLGPEMKLDGGARFDSAGLSVAFRTDSAPTTTNKEATVADSKDMRKIKLDAIPGVEEKFDGEYEVPAYLSLYFDKLKITLDSLKAKADKADSLEAERDAEKRRADAAEAKLDGFEQKVLDAAKERATLLSTAKDYVSEDTADKLDSMTSRQIKEAVIKTIDSETDLSAKSDEYVDAAYTLALKASKPTGDSTRTFAADPSNPSGGASVSLDSGMAEIRKQHNPFSKKG